MPAAGVELTLFDARPGCPRCGRKHDSPIWEVREKDGRIIEVCSVCARDFIGRHRQKP